MTRQAVSRQIAHLERELGVVLFRRTTAKVELTPVGELYVQFFAETQTRWEETRRKAESILADQGNLIHVGCIYDTDLGEWVLQVIETCRAKGHAIRVDWERREPHDLLEPLLDGRLDVVFSFEQAMEDCRQPELLDYVPIAQTQALLVVRDSHPLAVPGATAQDFRKEPCFLSEHMSPTNQRRPPFQEEWAEYGIQFTDVRMVPNRETLQTMVEMGRGVTICAEIDRFPRYPHLLRYPLGRTQTVVCIWRREEDRPQMRTFLDTIKENLI